MATVTNLKDDTVLPYCRRENYLQYISLNWLKMYEAILPGILVTEHMD